MKYYNPYILQGVLTAIEDGDPNADELISLELDKWVRDMWSW